MQTLAEYTSPLAGHRKPIHDWFEKKVSQIKEAGFTPSLGGSWIEVEFGRAFAYVTSEETCGPDTYNAPKASAQYISGQTWQNF